MLNRISNIKSALFFVFVLSIISTVFIEFIFYLSDKTFTYSDFTSFAPTIKYLSLLVFLLVATLTSVLFYGSYLNKRHQTQILEHQAKIRSLSDVKQRFISTISHEMKTPLHAIVSVSHQMKNQNDPSTSKIDLIEKLESSSQHLLKMVENILVFSDDEWTMNSGEGFFEPKKILTDTLQPFLEKASKKNLELTLSTHIPDIQKLKGSSFELRQILGHLLDNSLKFTHTGRIEVECQIKTIGKKQGILSLTVADTGIGIPRQHLSHIFEGPERTETVSKLIKEYDGIGLGLAISKRLTKSLGGTIKVESEVGVYTKFTVSIPYQFITEPTIKNEEDKQLHLPSVLLVDDDEFNVLLASAMLKRKNCLVTTALEGKKALELLENNTFDIVLLDIHMPRISGLQVAEIMRSSNGLNADTPILAVTATSLNRALIDKFKTVGINDFLPKPYEQEQLWHKMQQLLTSSSLPITPTKTA